MIDKWWEKDKSNNKNTVEKQPSKGQFLPGNVAGRGKGRPKKSPQDIYNKAMKVLNSALKSDDEKLAIRAADILMKLKAREKEPTDKTVLSPDTSAILGFIIEMIKNRPEISRVEDLIEKMMGKCLMCKRLGPTEEFKVLDDTSKFGVGN